VRGIPTEFPTRIERIGIPNPIVNRIAVAAASKKQKGKKEKKSQAGYLGASLWSSGSGITEFRADPGRSGLSRDRDNYMWQLRMSAAA